MIRQLAIVEIEGERFYDDERLREYRHLEKIMHVIPYNQIGDRKVKIVQEARELPLKNVKSNHGKGLKQ